MRIHRRLSTDDCDIRYEKGSILIFVDRQEVRLPFVRTGAVWTDHYFQSVDQMYRDLTASGYLCLALHGGMDQCDRDYTILDFKKQVRTVMVATSVAARGLDIKELILVINYNVPNHYEVRQYGGCLYLEYRPVIHCFSGLRSPSRAHWPSRYDWLGVHIHYP